MEKIGMELSSVRHIVPMLGLIVYEQWFIVCFTLIQLSTHFSQIYLLWLVNTFGMILISQSSWHLNYTWLAASLSGQN